VTSRCRVCGHEGHPLTFTLREMMYGTGEPFLYEQCAACGSLQISSIPADLRPYYPASYPAYQSAPRLRWFRRVTLALANSQSMMLRSDGNMARPLLRWIASRTFQTRIHPLAPLRGRVGSDRWEFADVGGANGYLLAELRHLGFRQVTCIDPYFEGTVEEGVRFIHRELHSIDGRFDVIMYHHTLEHVTDIPRELRAIRDRLSPRGFALLRLPVVPNATFEHYGEHWVQLDPPRHLHIPSRSGIQTAAARAGLEIVDSGDDSTDFQFWVSELYARGIGLREAEAAGGPTAFFTSRQLRKYRAAAMGLNDKRQGDQAWFIMRALA
jgi:SAM-dependent methyltransferase